MKLYLHIGTEKTGSSFLQSFLANNRFMLISYGLYFPGDGQSEADMQSGRISPGNASELNTFLIQKSWAKVERWLKEKYQVTKDNNCNKLLLSNEILIETFSESDVLVRFIQIAKGQGFVLQDLLMIIREPVSQALSLYKHRSKNGDMLPIAEWLKEKYNLAACLKRFYNNIEMLDLGLKQYPYKMNSQYLVEVCINKWLGFTEEIEMEHTSVNPSLTLSELRLMNEIKKQDTFMAKIFYKAMIAIPIQQKADDSYVKEFYEAEIANHLSKYQEVWELCNSRMTEGKTTSPKKQNLENVEKQQTIEFSFTELQITEITKLLVLNKSTFYKKQKFVDNLKSLIISFTPNFVLKQIIKIKN